MQRHERQHALGAKRIANDVRDALNLLAIYEEEYELPAVVVADLRDKLQAIINKLATEEL